MKLLESHELHEHRRALEAAVKGGLIQGFRRLREVDGQLLFEVFTHPPAAPVQLDLSDLVDPDSA
jgi:hypothetical protein